MAGIVVVPRMANNSLAWANRLTQLTPDPREPIIPRSNGSKGGC